tara:strand:+ start:480 stop:758 length:279 start_codon:yes stop_codon:yes gene_type:complete
MSDAKQIDALRRKEALEKLEKEKEKEIKKLKEQIKDAENEARQVEEQEEIIPIPQVATRDTSNLSEEGKQIVQAQRGTRSKELGKAETHRTP